MRKKIFNKKETEKLIMASKMINEIRSGLKYWNLDKVWPTNLYEKTLLETVGLINDFIFTNCESVSSSHIIDK